MKGNPDFGDFLRYAIIIDYSGLLIHIILSFRKLNKI